MVASAYGGERIAMSFQAIVFTLAGVVLAGVLVTDPSRGQSVTEEAWSHAGLAGTFAGPGPGAPPGPAVLILVGSGPTDRDGNGQYVSTDMYRMLAAGLAGAGIRSLRYDKRGLGGSAGIREEDLRFDRYVDDAMEAARDLAARKDVSGVVIAGHSEGGLVAILAARQAPLAGVVLLATPGRSVVEVLRQQYGGANPPQLRQKALDIIAALAAGGRVTDVPPALAPAFRPSVQPYLASMINIDPAKEFAQVKIPTLLIYSARDLQVSLADRDALAAARPDAEMVTLPEANHILKRAPADAEGNVKTYADRSLPLDPGVLPPIVEFVRKVAR
jgi:pimeloyl-ACP methyl ester carboxylesterase